jgi:glucosamine-6-phosphate deaminase
VEVLIQSTPELVGAVVADIVESYARRSGAVLGLATGSSPVGAYRELARRHREGGLSFANCRAFLLDEYVGLPREHEQSFYSVIRADFVNHVDFAAGAVHSPAGDAPDPRRAAEQYDAAIAAAGGIDVQLLGIGTNGHIGFNEPTSSLVSRTQLTTLTEQTRADNARFFDSIDEVPHHSITQGLGTICDARHLLLMANGEAKAAAVAAAVEGPLSAFCPASILQWHRHATVVIDEAAASGLRLHDYYQYTAEHKPLP